MRSAVLPDCALRGDPRERAQQRTSKCAQKCGQQGLPGNAPSGELSSVLNKCAQQMRQVGRLEVCSTECSVSCAQLFLSQDSGSYRWGLRGRKRNESFLSLLEAEVSSGQKLGRVCRLKTETKVRLEDTMLWWAWCRAGCLRQVWGGFLNFASYLARLQGGLKSGGVA